CVRIPFGRGVCGVAAETKTTQLVADVHQFPGHIACDSASNSEIVVPIVKEGAVIGVLDIDSPEKNRFDELDQRYLEKFVETLLKHM
ncbi:GAF domain-containing protein, partial [Bacillus thuringiensis]|nr:GAF domain-containing protein [Bacillus thuringiensis]